MYNYTDHLGNIRLSYTYDENTGLIKIMEENHYYPFGLKHDSYNTNRLGYSAYTDEDEIINFVLDEQPKFVGDGSYNYKYNGKELQDELGLNTYAYGWRDYDPALGRFNKMDRFSEMYQSKSPYNYAANNPIYYIDIAGDSLYVSHNKGFLGLGGKETLRYEGGKLFNKDGSSYSGKVKGFLKKATDALNEISNSKEGLSLLSELESSKNSYAIKKSSGDTEFQPSNFYTAYANQFKTDPNSSSAYSMSKAKGINFEGGSGGNILWNPSGSNIHTTKGLLNTPFIALGHEMFHASDANRGLMDDRLEGGVKRNEWQAIYRENIVRAQLTLPLRTHYQSTIDSMGNKKPDGPRMLSPAPLNNNVKPTWYK